MLPEPTLIIFDFPALPPAPGSAERIRALAEEIAAEPELLWKIWTLDQSAGRAGGIYLFRSRAGAEAYHAKHAARLGALGISGIEATYRSIAALPTAITRGPVPAPLAAG